MNPVGYALLAQEAYSAEPDIGSAFSSSRAICRQVDDGFCVTFRGSDNDASWATNFDILTLDDTLVGKVHKGFWEAWQVIAEQVKQACADAKSPIILCGHSLGAALAILAAADFARSGIPVKALYGFEPPCVSPQSNIREIISKTPYWLYRNGSDPVPDVPQFWSQSGDLIHLGHPAPFLDLKEDIEDHLLTSVIPALQAMYLTSPLPASPSASST
jgi:triacylglycerol lipase